MYLNIEVSLWTLLVYVSFFLTCDFQTKCTNLFVNLAMAVCMASSCTCTGSLQKIRIKKPSNIKLSHITKLAKIWNESEHMRYKVNTGDESEHRRRKWTPEIKVNTWYESKHMKWKWTQEMKVNTWDKSQHNIKK